MNVSEELQVLTHQKEVDELLVHDFKACSWSVCTSIENTQIQNAEIAGLENARLVGYFDLKFNALGDSENQSHATLRTLARLGGAVIRVHRTDPITVITEVSVSLGTQSESDCSQNREMSATSHGAITALS
jgi:hypothetical protein